MSKMKNRGDSRNRAMRDSLFSEEISVDPQYDFEYILLRFSLISTL